MATWPSTLPAPRTGYNLSPVDQTVRTDMESGAARVRRRTTARNDKVTVNWLFSSDQMATFRAWFEDATTGIAGGSGWFTVTLLLGTGGSVSTTARFIGPFTADLVPYQKWSVSGELEIRQ